MGKVTVTTKPNGNVEFAGGTMSERLDATIDWMVESNGGIEALAALIRDKAAHGATVPTANICGSARITGLFHGEPDMDRVG